MNSLTYEEILAISPFSLPKAEKEQLLNARLLELTKHHYEACSAYRRMLDGQGTDISKIASYYDIPFLPVALFKEMDLLSVGKDDVFKTMTSSGTTGQAVSKIYLDRTTASNQQKTLVKIVSAFTGSSQNADAHH